MINIKEEISWPKVDQEFLLEDNIKLMEWYLGGRNDITSTNFDNIIEINYLYYRHNQ